MSAAGGHLGAAHTVVEQALEASRSGDCIVIVEEASEADLRFANNTVTTNGTRRDRSVAVIAFRPTDGGTAVGTASSSGAADIVELVRRAEANAASAPPAEDASALGDSRAIGLVRRPAGHDEPGRARRRADRARRGFRAGRVGGDEPVRIRPASGLDGLSRFLDRLPAPLRGADRQARARRPR